MRSIKNIDCITINESELRHNFRDRETKIEILIKKLSSLQKIKNITVTRGADGAIMFDAFKNSFFYCPAFATNIVDKIGSGDAFLSLISLSEKNNNNHCLSLFFGSLAAAQSVETIGNSISINKIKMLKSIEHIMK